MPLADGHLRLDKELFVYTKPGLSSYADSPEAVSIYVLIEFFGIKIFCLGNHIIIIRIVHTL